MTFWKPTSEKKYNGAFLDFLLFNNFLLNENELSSKKLLKTGSLSDSYGDDFKLLWSSIS